MCSTCMQRVDDSLHYILQVPTSVIAPGGVPSSAMGRSVANYSGHVLKLVPGDHQYAFPLFSVVIIWNGHDKFTPTEFIKANAVRDWKLGILTRHLTEAIKLFEEVEGDIHESENPVLFDTFFELRDQVHIASQVLGDRTRGRAHTIPPVGPRTGTSTDLTYPMPKDYVAAPFIRHNIDPNIGVPHIRPPKTIENPIAPPQPAPPQPAQTAPQTGRLLIGFIPDPIWKNFRQDFFLPIDIPMDLPLEISQQHRASQSSQPTQPSQSQLSQPTQPSQSQSSQPNQPFPQSQSLFPTQDQPPRPILPLFPNLDEPTIDTQTSYPSHPPRPPLSAKQTAPSATVTSSAIPPPPPPPPPPPSTIAPKSTSSSIAPPATSSSIAPITTSSLIVTPATSSSSTSTSTLPSKKYNCKFCKYSSDRKNDWENHCNLHTGTRYKCGSCDRHFASIKNRTIHFKQVHLNQKRALCPVDKCNYSCNDHGIMKVHLFDDHGIGSEAKCKHCGKKFSNYRVYERHLKICTLPTDKQCPICQKSYKSTERLIGHMDVVHKGKARVICDQCGKMYLDKESLRVHKSSNHS